MTMSTGDEASILFATGQVVLDSNGYGFVRLAPAGQKWQITRTNVMASIPGVPIILQAKAVVYLGQISPVNVTDGSYAGSSGDTSDTQIFLNDGQPIFVEWTGGDPGATATVVINGWTSVPGRGFRAVH